MSTPIIEKIRKLLSLSENNTNVNEAAAAAALAQKLMEEYRIEQAMLETSTEAEKDEPIENDTLWQGPGATATWKGTLGSALCRVNACKMYYSRSYSDGRSTGRLGIIGRPSDAGTVRYMFAYLVREIERLADIEGTQRGQPGKTWYNSFKVGAASEVAARLYQAQKDARKGVQDQAGSGTELARVNVAIEKLDARMAAVRLWQEQNYKLVNRSAPSSRLDPGAFATGRRAGASIRLDSGPGLTAGSPRLRGK